MSNKFKVLALFGESGAGKDTLKDIIINREGLNNIVNTFAYFCRYNLYSRGFICCYSGILVQENR